MKAWKLGAHALLPLFLVGCGPEDVDIDDEGASSELLIADLPEDGSMFLLSKRTPENVLMPAAGSVAWLLELVGDGRFALAEVDFQCGQTDEGTYPTEWNFNIQRECSLIEGTFEELQDSKVKAYVPLYERIFCGNDQRMLDIRLEGRWDADAETWGGLFMSYNRDARDDPDNPPEMMCPVLDCTECSDGSGPYCHPGLGGSLMATALDTPTGLVGCR